VCHKGAISVDDFLEGVLMNEEEMREITGKLRDKIRKKFGKRREDIAGANGELSKPSNCEQIILVWQ